jgi:hypothetical protein
VARELERRGLLDATREHRPPHYHVAVFPRPYLAYLQTRDPQAVASFAAAVEPRTSATDGGIVHVVVRGDTLWSLGTRYGVPLARIRAENGIRGDTLVVGQRLLIPARDLEPAAVMVAAGGDMAAQVHQRDTPPDRVPSRSCASSTTSSARRGRYGRVTCRMTSRSIW